MKTTQTKKVSLAEELYIAETTYFSAVEKGATYQEAMAQSEAAVARYREKINRAELAIGSLK
jgi:hypothetical protein